MGDGKRGNTRQESPLSPPQLETATEVTHGRTFVVHDMAFYPSVVSGLDLQDFASTVRQERSKS